ncbi:MAG: extracellular solute-binding protein [Acetatifactor sp.]|nr:extracellular solute-binding protein [Acetatifactor sp.]
MHLKKRLISAAAVAAMAAAVLYGTTFEMSEADQEARRLPWTPRKDTIYFWYTDDAMTNYINSAAVVFGEREDVHVIPILKEDSEYLEAVNEASLHSEQMPDAYMINHDSLEKAYLAGLAVAVDDVAQVCDEAHFPASALSAVSYKGRTAAYPYFFETSVLVYNEDYLAEWAAQCARKELLGLGEDGEDTGEPLDESQLDPALLAAKTEEYFLKAIPGTVDDILTFADSYDVPEAVEGIMKWDVSDIFYNYWIVGNYMVVGGEAGDNEAQIYINNPETLQCLEVYKALNQFFYIESDTVTYESVIQDFMDGKLVFTIATSNVVERLAQAKAEGTLTFDYGFAPMPEVSGTLKSRSMSVTTAVAVNGYSSHKELANRFAAYLVDECADTLYEKTGKVSANWNADKDNGPLQIFRQEYAKSVSLPKMMETGNYWLLLERLFARVWNGEDEAALTQELSEQIASQVSGR